MTNRSSAAAAAWKLLPLGVAQVGGEPCGVFRRGRDGRLDHDQREVVRAGAEGARVLLLVEHRALREQLAAAEQEAEDRREKEKLEQQRVDKAQRVEELTRELAEAEAKLDELKNSNDGS